MLRKTSKNSSNLRRAELCASRRRIIPTDGREGNTALSHGPAWEAFAQASPLIELRVAEEWGHNPPLQDAAGTARMIAEWLGPYPAKDAER